MNDPMDRVVDEIDLSHWLLSTDQFCGLIVPCSSGVLLIQQAGGGCCIHPLVEGIFVPIGPSWMPKYKDDPLYDKHFTLDGKPDGEPGLYHPKLVDDWLASCESGEPGDAFRPPTVEEFAQLPDGARYCAEAWVPVIVKDWDKTPMRPADTRRVGRMAIVVYANSD